MRAVNTGREFRKNALRILRAILHKLLLRSSSTRVKRRCHSAAFPGQAARIELPRSSNMCAIEGEA